MSNSTYTTAVLQAWGSPEPWDAGGALLGGTEQAFREFGELAAKVQKGLLTHVDALRLSQVSQFFSASLNEIAARVNAIPGTSLTTEEIKLKAYIYNLQGEAQRLASAADILQAEVAAGGQNITQKLSANGAGLLKLGGAVLAVTQIGMAYYFDGANEGAKKVVGALGGLAAAPVGAWVGSGLVSLGAKGIGLVASGLAVSMGAVLGAAGAGYLAGKTFEESYGYLLRPVLDQMFDSGGAAWTAADTFYRNSLNAVGKLDGTWFESLTFADIADTDKAALTTLIAGATKVAVSDSLFNDIKKLFVADFTGEALVGRDILLQTILSFAKDNGYATERITASAGNVRLDLPNFPSSALNSLRDYVVKQLSPADQRGWALTGPSSIVVATTPGTNAAGTKDTLMVGTDGVDGLIGGAGDDDLIGGKGQDILLGGAGTDDIFGGEGDDVIDGGTGGDWLFGGAGNDTYQLNSGELFDVITDSDGNGVITVDGVTLTGGKKAGEGYWISADKQWGYSLTWTAVTASTSFLAGVRMTPCMAVLAMICSRAMEVRLRLPGNTMAPIFWMGATAMTRSKVAVAQMRCMAVSAMMSCKVTR